MRFAETWDNNLPSQRFAEGFVPNKHIRPPRSGDRVACSLHNLTAAQPRPKRASCKTAVDSGIPPSTPSSSLRKQIHSEESQLIATVQLLRAKGYLTQSEANSVRPKLAVIVHDVRSSVDDGQNHPPPLLRFTPADRRTSISYDRR